MHAQFNFDVYLLALTRAEQHDTTYPISSLPRLNRVPTCTA